MLTGAQSRNQRSVTTLGVSELTALSREWWALWHDDRGATPFSSPAWVLAFAQHFAPERAGAIALRERNRLVGLAPFFTWRGTLLLAGAGPSDYGEILLSNALTGGRDWAASEVLAAFAAVAEARACSRIHLDQVPDASPLLGASAPRGWTDVIVPGIACPVAPLEGSDGLGAVSRRWRKNVARAERQLTAHEDGRVRLVAGEQIEGAAQTLEQLHARRWQARGEPGVLSEPIMRGFIGTVLPALAAAGLLRLHVLESRGTPIAIAFVMHAHSAAYYYLGGFDPEWSKWSPGALAVVAAMRQAAAERATHFHFLRGQEPYKRRFGALDRPTSARHFSRAEAVSA